MHQARFAIVLRVRGASEAATDSFLQRTRDFTPQAELRIRLICAKPCVGLRVKPPERRSK
jgi:hypothetical protein